VERSLGGDDEGDPGATWHADRHARELAVSDTLAALEKAVGSTIGVGEGSLVFDCSRGRTFVARARARSPLRLLTPRSRSMLSWPRTPSRW